ncbi:hypothetical protein LDENG_00185670, partial [Lucifuga dentata]
VPADHVQMEPSTTKFIRSVNPGVPGVPIQMNILWPRGMLSATLNVFTTFRLLLQQLLHQLPQ